MYAPLSKKSMVKNPLQANNSTAKIRWMMAGSGKRLSFSEIGWMEGILIIGTRSLGTPITLLHAGRLLAGEAYARAAF